MAEVSLALWGAKRPGEQFGQSVHPRPEPVSRTAAPVTMMTHNDSNAASVM
jgi:hypothetical protein